VCELLWSGELKLTVELENPEEHRDRKRGSPLNSILEVTALRVRKLGERTGLDYPGIVLAP